MPKLGIVAGPHNGGAGTSIYEVIDEENGAEGLLATSIVPKKAAGDVIDAPHTPRHLAGVEFNGYLPDYFRP